VAEVTAVHEPSPFGVTSRKLGIWMFIVADAATFAAMLFAYGYMRVANPTGRVRSRSGRRSPTAL